MNDLSKGSPYRLTAPSTAHEPDGRKHRSQKSQLRIVNAMLELVAQGNLEPSADQIAETVFATVQDHALGVEAFDDQTIVVLKAR